jgi:hypothetical protein
MTPTKMLLKNNFTSQDQKILNDMSLKIHSWFCKNIGTYKGGIKSSLGGGSFFYKISSKYNAESINQVYLYESSFHHLKNKRFQKGRL